MDVTKRLASKSDPRSASKSDSENHTEPATPADQVSVVFQRDEKGYGLTVCGDNPVFVQVVTESGPAANVGLQPGDRIVRVNGAFVTKSNHLEVVRLIKSAPWVAMTVVRTAPVNSSSVASNGTRPSSPAKKESAKDVAAKDSRLAHLTRQLDAEVQLLRDLEKEQASDSVQMALNRVRNNIRFYQSEINRLQSTAKRESFSVGKPSRLEVPHEKDRGRSEEPPKDRGDQPPTPPPIERIPRNKDDNTTTGNGSASPRSSSGANINRRRSNPEAMHLGIQRMALASSLPDQSALNRSSSSVNVKSDGRVGGEDTLADAPPALPAKRSRLRNPSEDTVDLGTPSGSPPPPYPEVAFVTRANGHKVPKSGSFSGPSFSGSSRTQPARQLDIVTMEDANFAALSIHQGSFSDYYTLQKSLPHLAAFLHFSINVGEATPLLFHLITDMYCKGSSKEMQRWAYEIHSTFVVPGSPLELLNCTSCDHSHSSLITAVDEVLARPDREDVLRDVFNNARHIAMDAVQERLKDFQHKRTLGLGGMYNIDEHALNESVLSPERSRDFVDSLLGRDLENITANGIDEPENRCDRQAAVGCALATFLKAHGVKAMGRDGGYLVDKWPLFVQKDKSKFRLKDRSKKSVTVSGHQFAPVSCVSLCFCTYCGNCMWGVAPQGYQCTACEYTAHRSCVRSIEEPCVGEKKERRSFIMDGIFGVRKRSNNSPTAISGAKKSQEEKEAAEAAVDSQVETPSEAKNYVSQVVNRFESGKMQEGGTAVTPVESVDKNLKAQNLGAVGRSESLKTQKKQPVKPGVRKKSDPNHFYRDDGDDSVGTSGVGSLGISGASSVSSQSLPSNGSSNVSTEGILPEDEGSELEMDPDQIPNWQQNVDQTQLDTMDNRARKRQEVIAELFHTEQTHVRNLKVLRMVFYQPMMKDQLLSKDMIHQVFANLEEMITLHGELNKQMRVAKKTSPVAENIGDVLLSRFDGENGATFKRAAAAFCRDQASGLEALKSSQKKDPKLAQFLQEAAANPLCRRLQLKDIIPTGMQRLTKYPLLLENLLKYTPNETDEDKVEYEKIKKALGESKEILDFVNQAVKESALSNRLKELQEKIDMTPFNKSQFKMALEHKNLDISKYRLLCDGDLTWRLTKTKSVDLHLILLDKILLLVTKQDDKLTLKFHTPPVTTNPSDKKSESFSGKYWAPVLSLDGLFVKDVATDKQAFFLFTNATETGAQMYEMVANTVNEQKQWTRQIGAAIDRAARFYSTIPETFPVSATATIAAGPAVVPEPETENEADETHVDSDDESQGETIEESFFQTEDLPRAQLLASPSELVVTETRVLDAEVVLTPLEQLRRQDEQLEESLVKKQKLVSQILGISVTENDIVGAGNFGVSDDVWDAKTLLHRVMRHATSLTRLLKEALNVSEEQIQCIVSESVVEDVVDSSSATAECGVQTKSLIPSVNAEDLEPITTGLNRYLNSLMEVICRQEGESERLRSELETAREELRTLRVEARSRSPSRPQSCASFRSDEDLGRYMNSEVSALEEGEIVIPVEFHVETDKTEPESVGTPEEEIQHL